MMEPIDFVVTWVDGSDPKWQSERERFLPENRTDITKENRYRDWGLMKYWFRGVEKYAPWVRNIFFVTNGQVPKWLNTNHPKLKLIQHADYIPKQYLPTFNSNMIELWLHRIPELSEHFVLFNDDTFVVAPVEKEDFFKNGLPCEAALLDTIASWEPENCFAHTILNNFAIINKHFDKREVIRKNAKKFFALKYGKDLLRNICLLPFQHFSCFRDSHLPAALLKSTYEKVWRLEGEQLERRGTNRFRSSEDLTQWLMKSWQICEGNFVVRSTTWGHYFDLGHDSIDEICQSIEQNKYRAICLNDSDGKMEFEKIQHRLIKSFELILSKQSGFEKEGL